MYVIFLKAQDLQRMPNNSKSKKKNNINAH